MVYLGNPPATSYSTISYQDLTGGSGTSFTLDYPVATAQEIEVFVNNVRQEPGVAYTVAGTALTTTGSISVSDDFYVVFQGKAQQTATHPPTHNLEAADGTFSGNASVTGTSTLTGAVTVGPADSGGTANTNADDLVIDNAADGGITILSANTAAGSVRFGDPDGANPGIIKYDHSDDSLQFYTNAAEEMRITSVGALQLGTAVGDAYGSGILHVGGQSWFTNDFRVVSNVGENPAYTDASSDTGIEITEAGFLVYVCNNAGGGRFCRTGTDGAIVNFYAQGSAEGSISVSGSTVSYNGGHLARWSQLADNTRDETIVKGTVMTNLDQMADWTNDGVTEDNEQLNCMAVSSVEGDPNVAGVFVNWDNDDDIYHNDMNVAMTGDMVIRIANGTTVARGDLLMSAGDGTAKPQDDDIVRSKTIAKVTSTHVSHTYDDGSYLVPCVLMAC